ncbi:NADH-ubiquinone oxidoreductase-F iron-sulfur binding region domain-containing protein, partial [Bacteroidota bacterium]
IIGLSYTSDIGMNDQEPAALINGEPFTNLTPERARELVQGFREGKEVKEMIGRLGYGKNANDHVRSMVNNNVHKEGQVIFSAHKTGAGLKKAISYTPRAVVELIKESHLRGRGGAGFPAGLKWDFCRQAGGDAKYLVCNADEGEPGTFKERVLLTEKPELLFEGMAIAGYAIDALEGILYLRYEYIYLKDYLESVLEDMRSKKLLGKNILKLQGFDFDIRIQMGAGAYVCGEESALIESMEGKRGEPRNRPPFPVQAGYLGKPTVVNNVETLCCVAQILEEGAEWFRSIGTAESSGTKLLSIAGDCKNPGVYEIEYGITVKAMLEMAGAENVQAVQVGGPSGVCIDPSQFNRTISFEDLPTGGSIIIISNERDLIKEVVLNFMDFFIDESCSSCAPCRSLTVIIKNMVEKLLRGKGTRADIDNLLVYGLMMKNANRCGLGQTASNPIVSTIENFRDLYESLVTNDADYISEFDMESSVAASCAHVGRIPKFEH